MSKHTKTIVILALVALVSVTVYVRKYGVPFVTTKSQWSIGIYAGDTPLNVHSPEGVNNPVLTAEDVTDVKADFVADPFMIKKGNVWYMFFEVMNRHTGQGDIGVATSLDGFRWEYKQIVLDEPYHLSYPYVFDWEGDYYMIPESNEAESLRLYKADDFPIRWSLVKTLLKGHYTDSSIFRYNGLWWIFTENNPKGSDMLGLYYANDLTGPWTEHPKSPVIKGDANIARPGGRVTLFQDRIIRYTQDDYPVYGNQLRAFEITELTTTNYKEKEVRENPILAAGGKGWNAQGMHHIDPHQTGENTWIAAVDGNSEGYFVFGFGY